MADFNNQNTGYTRLVDRYSRYVESPVLRLKFLNSALKITPAQNWMTKIPFIGTLPERALIVLELSKVLPPNQPAPFAIRMFSLLYRIRFAIYAASAVFAVAVCTSAIYAGSKLVSSLIVSTEARGVAPPPPTASPQGVDALATIGSEAGLSLDKVWMAEQGEGYEFYSNGARVLTEFETTGEPRNFYRFTLDKLLGNSDEAELLSKPVGIVYHLSQSDLLPFANDYNSSLQNRSKSLLDYARERRLYNYVIDRFGRTYRIVRDEFASNHAGNSLWSDGRNVYVNLNSSFIGICFEGKSDGGAVVGPDGINEAQIYAARVLTAVLRSRYGIEDSNCVTHGLVSINPSNRLMGYHTDWVSGFPFDALGLSDKNESELIAISQFGFTYDQAYTGAAGGRKWPGLVRADAAWSEAVKKNGHSAEEESRARWKIFQRAQLKQRALDKAKNIGGE